MDLQKPHNWRLLAWKSLSESNATHVVEKAIDYLTQRPQDHRAVFAASEELSNFAPETASEILTYLTKLRPENPEYLNLLGVAQKRSGDLDAAIRSQRGVITLDSSNGSYYYALGKSLAKADNTEEAIKHLITAADEFGHRKAAKLLKQLSSDH